MQKMAFAAATVTLISVAGAASVLLGPEWEQDLFGDAGKLPGTGQTVGLPGGGPLGGITGLLGGIGPSAGTDGDFQDVFRIRVNDPIGFQATTFVDFGGFADFDTQLFLFDCDGVGLLANDDVNFGVTESFLPSNSNDGTGVQLVEDGIYLLAISGFNSDALGNDLLIFDQASSVEVSGPDGPGGLNPLTDWLPGGDIGNYRIALQGATLIDTRADCPGDVNNDWQVDILDLLALLKLWGPCDKGLGLIDCVCPDLQPLAAGDTIYATAEGAGGNKQIFLGAAGIVECGRLWNGGGQDLILCSWDIDNGHDGMGLCDCEPGAGAPDGIGWFVTCDELSNTPPGASTPSGKTASTAGSDVGRPSMDSSNEPGHRRLTNGPGGIVEDPCPADFDSNGFVDTADLLELLANWGPCPCIFGL